MTSPVSSEHGRMEGRGLVRGEKKRKRGDCIRHYVITSCRASCGPWRMRAGEERAPGPQRQWAPCTPRKRFGGPRPAGLAAAGVWWRKAARLDWAGSLPAKSGPSRRGESAQPGAWKRLALPSRMPFVAVAKKKRKKKGTHPLAAALVGALGHARHRVLQAGVGVQRRQGLGVRCTVDCSERWKAGALSAPVGRCKMK